MKLIWLLLLIAFGSQTSECFRVLGLFPHPAISHFQAFQPLLKQLANNGHEVYVVSHFPETNSRDNYQDFVLDQSQVLTASYPVDEVSCVINSFPIATATSCDFHYFDLQNVCHDN